MRLKVFWWTVWPLYTYFVLSPTLKRISSSEFTGSFTTIDRRTKSWLSSRTCLQVDNESTRATATCHDWEQQLSTPANVYRQTDFNSIRNERKRQTHAAAPGIEKCRAPSSWERGSLRTQPITPHAAKQTRLCTPRHSTVTNISKAIANIK